MPELQKGGWSAPIGGVIGYGVGALLNPILVAHGLPALPDAVTTGVGIVVFEQAAKAVRHSREQAEIARKREAAKTTLAELEQNVSTYVRDGGESREKLARAQVLLANIEKARAASERGDFEIAAFDKTVTTIADEFRIITAGKTVSTPEP